MASVINAVSGSGITQTADGSGVLKIQSNSVTTNALAWVNFNGAGTAAIRSSYNVSSVTRNGTGDYTVNFATTLSDANYCALVMAGDNTSNFFAQRSVTYTTTSYRFYVINNSGGANDTQYGNVAIFGN